MELVRGNLKGRELANLCPRDIIEARTAAEAGLDRIGGDYERCYAFLDHTGLRL